MSALHLDSASLLSTTAITAIPIIGTLVWLFALVMSYINPKIVFQHKDWK